MTAVHPELARAFRDANREAAEAAGREVGRVESLREAMVEPEAIRRWADRVAWAATRELAAAADELAVLWAAAIPSLRTGTVDEQVGVLREFVGMADSARGRVPSATQLWAAVERLGGTAEGADELARAVRQLATVYRESTRSIEARVNPWRPKDPAQFEQVLRDVAEGKVKFLTAEEFRARFRQTPG